jgi:hypothetical protein
VLTAEQLQHIQPHEHLQPGLLQARTISSGAVFKKVAHPANSCSAAVECSTASSVSTAHSPNSSGTSQLTYHLADVQVTAVKCAAAPFSEGAKGCGGPLAFHDTNLVSHIASRQSLACVESLYQHPKASANHTLLYHTQKHLNTP